MADIKTELAAAVDGDGNMVYFRPALAVRFKLAEFALVNGLRDENEAAAVIVARYFGMVEGEKPFAALYLAKAASAFRCLSWLASREGS